MSIFMSSVYIPTGGWMLTEKEVFYAMPFMPVTGEPRIWDSNNEEHERYINLCRKIYSSKYKNSNSYYYLFNEDLLDTFESFFNWTDARTVIPIGSTHPLVYHFADYISSAIGCSTLDVINKVEKGVFTLDNNKTLPEGKILLVDDIITSGSAIVSAIQTLLKTGKYQLEDIDILCIGKTERDLNVWDNNKVIANLT
ncbi:hypothetical protein CM49_06617 [Paenibacillus sp. P1XP2]|nr:hypothetical protein CM49_06617 [Paenibacillus sp. P1XP2]